MLLRMARWPHLAVVQVAAVQAHHGGGLALGRGALGGLGLDVQARGARRAGHHDGLRAVNTMGTARGKREGDAQSLSLARIWARMHGLGQLEQHGHHRQALQASKQGAQG